MGQFERHIFLKRNNQTNKIIARNYKTEIIVVLSNFRLGFNEPCTEMLISGKENKSKPKMVIFNPNQSISLI